MIVGDILTDSKDKSDCHETQEYGDAQFFSQPILFVDNLPSAV